MDPLTFYRQFITSSDLVFDVGANIGERTAIFAQLARKVIAVEPIETAIAELYIPNVYFEDCGCADHNGYEEIVYDPKVTGLATMSPSWLMAVKKTGRFSGRDWPRLQRVGVVTLDYLIQKYGTPAFIKIDVEGYELHVLRGLSQPVKALSFEWHPETWEASTDCIARCMDLGFTKFAVSEMETFELSKWWSGLAIAGMLKEYDGNVMYGDVYARSEQ